jgi:chromosome segregation ATPase
MASGAAGAAAAAALHASVAAWQPKPFKRGAVVRVRMTNFMTYDQCEFAPGPRLNLVIGANGSGKSTLVCALGVGLGGNQSVVERVKDLTGFIKNGKDEAEIEIELFEGAGVPNTVVRRRLSREKKRCEDFTYNGRKMGRVDFEAKLKSEFDIQVNNLCQFLPQEKVGQFSKLTASELLKETIRAGLGDDMLEQQDALSKQAKDLKEASVVASRQQAELERKEADLAKLESAVKSLQERAEVERAIKVHEDKLIFLDINDTYARYSAAKKAAKSASKAALRAEEQMRTAQASLAEQQRQVREIGDGEREREDARIFKEASARLKALLNKAGPTLESAEQKVTDAAEWGVAQQKLAEKLAECRAAAAASEAALRAFVQDQGSLEQLKERRGEADRRVSEALQSELQVLQQKKNLQRTMGELERSQSDIRARLESFRGKQTGALDLVGRLPNFLRDQVVRQWRQVEQWRQQGRLKAPVHLLVSEVQCSDVQNCVFLERAVTAKQLGTFVTTLQEDRQLLMNDNQHHFTVINVLESECNLKVGDPDSAACRALRCRPLDSLVRGPPAVLQALRNIASIQSVLCGDAAADGVLNTISESVLQKDLAGKRVFTPAFKYAINVSRYGERHVTMQAEPVNAADKPRILMKDTSAEERAVIDGAERDLAAVQGEMVPVRTELAALAEKEEMVRLRKAEMQNMLTAANEVLGAALTLHKTAERDAAALERAKAEAGKDASKQLERNLQAVHELLGKGAAAVEDAAKCSVSAVEAQGRWLELVIRKVQASANQATLEREVKELKATVARANRAASDAKEALPALKAKFHALGNKFKERGGDADAVAQLDDDRSTVEAALMLLKHRLGGATVDTSVVKRHEQLKKEVEELTNRLGNAGEMQAAEKDDYDSKLYIWESGVELLMNKINANFKEAFANVRRAGYHCDGAVELLKHEDVKDYGVGIKVKFRKDGELHRLDAHTQSGGERSLSTFMYLLALNEVSNVSFRVVDEINQGMDEDKERISLTQLMGASCGGERVEQRAQYFLITPKLLTGLEYHPDVTVHVIFNGPGAPEHEGFNMRSLINAAHRNSGPANKRQRV